MKLPDPVAQIAFHYARNESNKITVDLPIETRLFTEAQMREALAQQEAAMRQALEALNKAASTCFTRIDRHEFMSRPDHFCNQAIKALEEALK